MGGIVCHEGADKVLKQVGSALCLRQHQPEQEDALELIVEGYPQKLLNDRLCRLQKAVDNPGALPNGKSA